MTQKRIDPRIAAPSAEWRRAVRGAGRHQSRRLFLVRALLWAVAFGLFGVALPDLEWWRGGALALGVAIVAILVSER